MAVFLGYISCARHQIVAKAMNHSTDRDYDGKEPDQTEPLNSVALYLCSLHVADQTIFEFSYPGRLSSSLN